MILETIRLYLNTEEFDHQLRSEFLFRACYVSNYLTRRTRKLKFETDGFRGILVQGCKEASAPRVSSERNLIAPVVFPEQRYRAMSASERHELYLGLLLKGFEEAARYYEIPLSEEKSAIEDFRAGGYRNEWTYKKKALREAGLRASLLCSLDTERFVLTLRLERKADTVFNQVILETKPDELIFAHRFKDVVVEHGAIVVQNRFGKPTFSLQLSSLP